MKNITNSCRQCKHSGTAGKLGIVYCSAPENMTVPDGVSGYFHPERDPSEIRKEFPFECPWFTPSFWERLKQKISNAHALPEPSGDRQGQIVGTPNRKGN